MQTESNSIGEVSHRERIWFFPNKFWQVTKGMPHDEVSKLMEEVEQLAAAGNMEALRQYPFVFVGDPYKHDINAA